MHQDTKTFSNLADIDTGRKLMVDLRIRKHGRTVGLVKLNGFVINVDSILFEFDLLDSVKLEIELIDFDEGSSGIEIEYFGINGYEILPIYRHLASRPTTYIDTKGSWSFEIPRFYPWYQKISGGSDILNIGVL